MKPTNLLMTAACGLLVIGCGSDKNYPDIKIPDGNATPMASDASFTTQTDTELAGELMAMDDDGDDLTFALVGEPTNGSVTVAENGMFSYQPNATVTGSDSFTFEVSDGEAISSLAMVNITIETLELSFSTYSRQAFEQMPTDESLPLNGRTFEQDVTEPDAYDDLLTQ